MNAILPVNAACPRCGGSFRCGAADKTCVCFGLNIGTVLRAQLAAEYSECLCVKCLAELQVRQNEKQEP